jgi:hypothetical protein
MGEFFIKQDRRKKEGEPRVIYSSHIGVGTLAFMMAAR